MMHLRLKENTVLEHPFFEQLKKGDRTEHLEDLFTEQLPYFYHLKSQLIHSVVFQDRTLLELVPLTKNFRWEEIEVDPEQKFQLSRFCYLHRVNGEWVLETPLCAAKVIVKDLNCLGHLSDFPQEVSRECLVLLQNAKMLETADEQQFPLLAWEFHDLLFASRSRLGRHDHPLGGHYPFQGKIPPLPAVKERTYLESFPLFTPDIESLKQEDVPFTYVVEERKSKREQIAPVTVEQLGEFLYRSARIKKINLQKPQDTLHRPFPSGGAIHEIEIYPLVYQCAGIEQGLYHYNGLDHKLGKISEFTPEIKALLQMSQHATGKSAPPQILFILSARFQRFSWKYQSISYACMLKNSGVLIQTMYLIATAMKLSPCGVGCGDSDLFAKAADLNYYEETSIGEFILS